MVKRALVVDDSKSARFVLKRMLNTFKLEVDTVESAVDAINYLQTHLPDVIFMDHMMPGMDGFEAVKRIKKNPQTAIIPIMMYTSKGGDVYLSQARALGAVGIIRKTIAPVELKSSLLELKLIDDLPYESTLKVERSVDNKTQLEKIVKNASQKDSTLDTYIKDLHRLIDDQTIELHRSMWLGIESASNEIFNRLNSDFENKMQKMQTDFYEENTQNTPPPKNKVFRPVYIISILLLLSLAFNFMLVNDSDEIKQDKISATNNVENDIQKTQSIVNIANNKIADMQLQEKFIQWASDKIIEYPYDEVALNDARLPNIEALIKRALKANFKGKIILQTHAGSFCLNINQMGNYKLAEAEISIGSCDFIGNFMQLDDSVTSHQSLSFVNFLSDAESLNKQGIVIEVISLSRQIELSEYPKRTAKIMADEWNQAAQLNNRITVVLEPDAVD